MGAARASTFLLRGDRRRRHHRRRRGMSGATAAAARPARVAVLAPSRLSTAAASTPTARPAVLAMRGLKAAAMGMAPAARTAVVLSAGVVLQAGRGCPSCRVVAGAPAAAAAGSGSRVCTARRRRSMMGGTPTHAAPCFHGTLPTPVPNPTSHHRTILRRINLRRIHFHRILSTLKRHRALRAADDCVHDDRQ